MIRNDRYNIELTQSVFSVYLIPSPWYPEGLYSFPVPM